MIELTSVDTHLLNVHVITKSLKKEFSKTIRLIINSDYIHGLHSSRARLTIIST